LRKIVGRIAWVQLITGELGISVERMPPGSLVVAVAIGAFELDQRAVGALANRLHVHGVVEPDRVGGFGGVAENSNFGMTLFEASDVSPFFALQLGMTEGAAFVAHGRQ